MSEAGEAASVRPEASERREGTAVRVGSGRDAKGADVLSLLDVEDGVEFFAEGKGVEA